MNGLLLALDDWRTILAVFGVVGFRLKYLAANRAPFRGVIAEDFRFQRLSRLIFQQHMTEEHAVYRI